jgi:transglutaminase-like putative cysteine protease
LWEKSDQSFSALRRASYNVFAVFFSPIVYYCALSVPITQGNIMVRFELVIDLQYQVFQSSDFIFNFHPAQTPHQAVSNERLVISPYIKGIIRTDSVCGNRHLRLHVEPSPLTVQYSATVDIQHHFAAAEELQELRIDQISAELLQYVLPSRYCQSDALPREALTPFLYMAPGYGRVQAICDWVRDRTRFQVGTTNSATTALDTYRDRVGVCRDFAHLMITVCRALNIPARFATSIDYGADPSLGPTDFHAYVEAFLGDRWWIFDPTGISPATGLLRIGVGRDAVDTAFATIFGNVLSGMPSIRIQALQDQTAGLVLPASNGGPVSTDDRLLFAMADPARIRAGNRSESGIAQAA